MRFIRLYLSFYKCLLCPLTIFFLLVHDGFYTLPNAHLIVYYIYCYSICIHDIHLRNLIEINVEERIKTNAHRTLVNTMKSISLFSCALISLSLSLFHFMFFSFLLVPSNDSTFLCEPFFSYSSFNVYVAVMVFSRCCFFLFVKFGLHHQVKSENIGTGHFRFISQSSLLFLLFRSLRLFCAISTSNVPSIDRPFRLCDFIPFFSRFS